MQGIWYGLQGSAFGTSLGINDVATREVEMGQQVEMTALTHIGHAWAIESFTSSAFGVHNDDSFIIQSALAIGLGLAHYLGQTSTDVHVRQWCHYITDNFLTASRVVNAVAVLALFYMGNFVMGTAVCTMFSLALLDKAGYLPELAQKVYYNILLNEYFMLIAMSVVSSGLLQVCYVVRLVCRVMMVFEKYCFPVERTERTILNPEEPGRLTDRQFSELLRGNVEVEIDPSSIFKNVPDYRGPTPEIDFERALLRLFDDRRSALPFQRLIAAKAGRDDIYRAAGQRNAPGDRLAFARTSLTHLIHGVKEQNFAAGVQVDYADLERKLKIVAQYLTDHYHEQPDFVDDCLAKLAIEGGYYCQAGKVPAILQVYREVAFKLCLRADAPEHAKIRLLFYQILANRREQLFQSIFQSDRQLLWKWNFTRQILLNRHMYNVFIEYYGEPFGLVSTGAENDVIAQVAVNEPLWWLFNKFLNYAGMCIAGQQVSFKDLMRIVFFNEHYTPTTVVEYIREATSFENRRASDNIIPWITAWINSRQMPAEQKAAIIDQISDIPVAVAYEGHHVMANLVTIDGQTHIFDVQVPTLPERRVAEPEAEYLQRRNAHIMRNMGSLFPARRIAEPPVQYIPRAMDYVNKTTLLRDNMRKRLFQAMLMDMGILRASPARQ